MYDQAELVHGAEIMVPWKSKDKITKWKGIFVDCNAQTTGWYKMQLNIYGLPTTILINYYTHIAKTCETGSEMTTSKLAAPKLNKICKSTVCKTESEMPKLNKRSKKCELCVHWICCMLWIVHILADDNKSKANVLQISNKTSKRETTINKGNLHYHLNLVIYKLYYM